MKVVNLAIRDYANFSHDNANALRSVGVNCSDYKIQPHANNYQEQSIIIDKGDISKKIKNADIVQVMHSDYELLPFIGRHKKLIVWHKFEACFLARLIKKVFCLWWNIEAFVLFQR